MKTCEEMARSVMHRAKAHKAVMKRRVVTVTAAVLCICCIGLVAFAMNAPIPEEPVAQLRQTAPVVEDVPAMEDVPTIDDPVVEDPVQISDARVTFLSASGESQVIMREGVTLPLKMEMRVKNLQGLTEEEKEAIIEAEGQYAESVVKSVASFDKFGYYSGPGYHWTQYTSDDHVLTTIIAGHFRLAVGGSDDMESIYFETGGAIQLCYLPDMEEDEDYEDEWRYHLDEAEIKQYYHAYDGGFVFTWLVDGREVSEMNKKPVFDPSAFSDYIKVVVTFKDGTVETHQIDIVITEDGQTSAIYRGQPATV